MFSLDGQRNLETYWVFFLAVLVLMMEDHTENAYKSVHTGYVVLSNIATCLNTL